MVAMVLFSKSNNKKQPDRKANPSVSRPGNYAYHAVRSSTERRTNRGQLPKRTSKLNFAEKAERVVSLVIFSVILGSLLYLFWLDNSVNVRVANSLNYESSQDTLLRNNSDYESGAKQILSNGYLTRTKLTINTQKVENELLSNFPELATATVTLPLTGHKPLIIIQPKQPTIILSSKGQSYVVDQNGVAVARLSEIDEKSLETLKELPQVRDESGLDINNGERILTVQTIRFITQLKHQYQSNDISITQFVLPSQKPNEVRVTENSESYYVKYTVDQDPAKQFGVYRAVVTQAGGEWGEYIDVRVPGKAFFK